MPFNPQNNSNTIGAMETGAITAAFTPLLRHVHTHPTFNSSQGYIYRNHWGRDLNSGPSHQATTLLETLYAKVEEFELC